MLSAFLLITAVVQLCDSQKLLLKEDNSKVANCVKNIILNWNEEGTVITYVDINYRDNDVIKVIHDKNFAAIVSRTANVKVDFPHNAYVIVIEDYITFKNEFLLLLNEKDWKPNAHMLLVFRRYESEAITDLFYVLFRLHIFDVLVIYATNDIPIYTYSPFQNKNCGKTFEEIVKYDNCSEANVERLFLEIPAKDLKGCTFDVGMPHWPPFSIHPFNNESYKQSGIEQYLMELLSEILDFNLTYTYLDKAEEFTLLDENMTATGNLGLLQEGHTDIVLGGMMLTFNRANAFSYLHGYQDFEDELSILVKKAGPVPTWKNIYLEFSCLTWTLLAVAFFIFFVIFSILFRIKDKCNFILIMLDLLFLHTHILRSKRAEFFLFQWVIFAFLVNAYYQSNLSGLTTHVSYDYQISSTKDIRHYKLKPCLSPIINIYIKAVTGLNATNETNEECNNLVNSINVTSKDYTKFTITVLSKCKVNYYKFIDEFGELLLYKFPLPKSKLIYAIYFYKGFPIPNDLYYNVLRVRENGLLEKRTRDIKHEVLKNHQVKKKHGKAPFIFPWQVLVVGYALSTVTFLVEILMDYVKRKSRNNLIYLE